MKQVPIIPLLKFDNTKCPFKIQTLKSIAEEAGESIGSVHSQDYHEIIWVIKGSGTVLIDLNEHSIEDNMIFCLKPNQAHQFPINAGMEGFAFSFADKFLNMGEHEFDISVQACLYQLFSECKPLRVQKDIEEEIRDLSLKMLKEYENQYAFKALLLKRYFRIFLILLSRQLQAFNERADQTRETELVKRFLELLDKGFREEKMVSAYAAQLAVTANYLNRLVKKHTGYSAGHHVRQRVVLEAKRLARYSGSGMKEIAFALGFFDSAHFSRFFKSFAGANFTDFKKESLNLSIGPYLNGA